MSLINITERSIRNKCKETFAGNMPRCFCLKIWIKIKIHFNAFVLLIRKLNRDKNWMKKFYFLILMKKNFISAFLSYNNQLKLFIFAYPLLNIIYNTLNVNFKTILKMEKIKSLLKNFFIDNTILLWLKTRKII